MSGYPPDAFSPDGTLWWEQELIPGGRQRLGVSKRIAAWIYFNLDIGATVTMRQLRAIVSNDGRPNTDEHFNRRFRELRDSGWKLVSNKEDSSLGSDEYRLETRGSRTWIEGDVPQRTKLSARIRRQVFERDGKRCQICGIGANEEYPNEPGTTARMTVGHVRANALDGGIDMLNLRTECSRCNEPIRDEVSSGEVLDTVWPQVRRLSKGEKQTLLIWIEHGSRPPTEVAMIFDVTKALTAAERLELLSRLRKAT